MADENFFCFRRKSGWCETGDKTGKINTFINGRYNKTYREIIYEYILYTKRLRKMTH